MTGEQKKFAQPQKFLQGTKHSIGMTSNTEEQLKEDHSGYKLEVLVVTALQT